MILSAARIPSDGSSQTQTPLPFAKPAAWLGAGLVAGVGLSVSWGQAPVIHDGLVIVQADVYKDSFIAAYKLKNGKQAWKTARDEIPTWGTPTIFRGEKRHELGA